MNKAIILDRDGTINIDYGYVHKIDDFKYIDGAIEGLKILNDLGYILIIVTNQSGIGRGYFSIDEYEILNNYMIDSLSKENIIISRVYMCPHTDKDNCECRKPKLKLFYQAIKDFNIDINNSYVIGDKERDLAICQEENINGILLSDEENKNYICKKNLYDAAIYIKKRTKME